MPHAILHQHPAIAVAVAGFFFALICAEIIAYRCSGRRYAWREAGISIAVAAGQRILQSAALLVLVPLYGVLWSHRVWTVPVTGTTGFLIALVAVEFAYYWMHRASHRIAWMWTTHSVHHSALQLNFLAALRLGGTGLFTFEWLPFAVLVLLGFAPATVGALFALDLVYQFLLHSDILTRIAGRQWIFNTPSDHRVHHAINAPYIDRNFGGMLIVFDRLFGTYAPERADERPRFGLVGEQSRTNPLRVMLGGWATLFARLRAAGSLRERLLVALGPPSPMSSSPDS